MEGRKEVESKSKTLNHHQANVFKFDSVTWKKIT